MTGIIYQNNDRMVIGFADDGFGDYGPDYSVVDMTDAETQAISDCMNTPNKTPFLNEDNSLDCRDQV